MHVAIDEANYTQPEAKIKSVKKEPVSTPTVSSKRGRQQIDDDFKPSDKKTSQKQATASLSALTTIAASSTSKKILETAKALKKEADDDSKGLEELYYGVEDGTLVHYESFPFRKKAGIPGTVAKRVECPLCDSVESFDSNEKLQTHLVSHITFDDKDHQFQCLFCLEKHASEALLSKHSQLMHPTETKSASSTNYHCLICQQRFNSLSYLTSHLQRVHNVLELPYNCQACGYRSSSHRDVVRHFYDEHKNQNFLQCPFCLGVSNLICIS